jgi:hypothetical protein
MLLNVIKIIKSRRLRGKTVYSSNVKTIYGINIEKIDN